MCLSTSMYLSVYMVSVFAYGFYLCLLFLSMPIVPIYAYVSTCVYINCSYLSYCSYLCLQSWPICVPFFSFSWLMALAKASSTILSKWSGHGCLISDSSVFPLLYIGYKSVIRSLYGAEVCFSYSQFLQGLNHEGMLDFARRLFCLPG